MTKMKTIDGRCSQGHVQPILESIVTSWQMRAGCRLSATSSPTVHLAIGREHLCRYVSKNNQRSCTSSITFSATTNLCLQKSPVENLSEIQILSLDRQPEQPHTPVRQRSEPHRAHSHVSPPSSRSSTHSRPRKPGTPGLSNSRHAICSKCSLTCG